VKNWEIKDGRTGGEKSPRGQKKKKRGLGFDHWATNFASKEGKIREKQ